MIYLDPCLDLPPVKLPRFTISARQAAEWGMGAVEKVFRRLLMPLQWNQSVRATRLKTIHYLYNYRVRMTGISQIRSVYYLDEE